MDLLGGKGMSGKWYQSWKRGLLVGGILCRRSLLNPSRNFGFVLGRTRGIWLDRNRYRQ